MVKKSKLGWLEPGWYTSALNRAGTGHRFTEREDTTAKALCGAHVHVDDLQGESEIIARCKRCEKLA